MKNILIHLHPSKKFDYERGNLVKIQIASALQLGWNPNDIWLITNFDYEYNGIKSIVVDGSSFCAFKPRSTNTVTVPHLFELGMIEKGEMYWVHDFDAYQQHPFTEEDLQLDGFDVAFTTYGWLRMPYWCLGSFFFKFEAEDIFQWIKNKVYELKVEDEWALEYLIRDNYNDINSRYKLLNLTYNFGMKHVSLTYPMADKPLKVIHFHPTYDVRGLKPINVFMHGKSDLGFPLMTPELIEIFKNNGYDD